MSINIKPFVPLSEDEAKRLDKKLNKASGSAKKSKLSYQAILGAAAGFAQTSETFKSVYVVDFSDIFPLLTYNENAGAAFTFQGKLSGDAGIKKSELASHKQKWQQIDLSRLKQLLLDTDHLVCTSNPHLDEMHRVSQTLKKKTGGFANAVSSINSQNITAAELGRIKEWYEKLEHDSDSSKLEFEHLEFIKNYFPSWALRDIQKIVESARQLGVLETVFNETKIKLFSADDRSIFKAISNKYALPIDRLDEFWSYVVKPEVQTTIQQIITNLELMTVRSTDPRKAESHRTDFEALADLHVLNDFLALQEVPIRFELVTRTPYLHNLQAMLPPKFLNVVIRHPALLPEIYDYSPHQLRNAQGLVNQIASAIADYDATWSASSRKQREKLDERLDEAAQNLGNFVIDSDLVKDVYDEAQEKQDDQLETMFGLSDSANHSSDVDTIKKFLTALHSSLLEDDSDIYQRSKAIYTELERTAASVRVNARRGKREQRVYVSQALIAHATPNISALQGRLIIAPGSYMTPGFYLYDAELFKLIPAPPTDEYAFRRATINADNLDKVIKNLERYQEKLETAHPFLKSRQKLSKYFLHLSEPSRSAADIKERLAELSAHSPTEELTREVFEKVLVQYLSVHQMRAYYYAIFLQHRYAGIVCSDVISLLFTNSPQSVDNLEGFNRVADAFKDKTVILCFKELLLLRQYCERALGFETDYDFSERKNETISTVVLRTDRPFFHFARADRGLHFANLCHRVAVQGNSACVVTQDQDDIRILLARFAGYLENVLKSFTSIKDDQIFVERLRSVFWSAATNGQLIEQSAQQLINTLKQGETSKTIDPVWAEYLKFQIAKAYHINLTTLMLFMADARVVQLNAFWNPFEPLEHANILGFNQVFLWARRLDEYQTSDDKSPFYSKTKATLLGFVHFLEKVRSLRNEKQTPLVHKEIPDEADLREYIKLLEDLKTLLGRLNSAARDTQADGQWVRKESFFSGLVTLLLERTEGLCDEHKSRLDQAFGSKK